MSRACITPLIVGELLGPAQAIHQFHLRNCRTGNFEQLGIGKDHRKTAGSADSNVQAISAIQKFDVPGENLA